MIRSELRNLSLGRLVELKRIWGVSVQALIERARHLGVLSADQRTVFYKQLSHRGWRKREPASEDIAPEVPRLSYEIAEALADRGLSDEEIANLTGFSPDANDNPFRVTPRLRAL